jgi:hypothetical protein
MFGGLRANTHCVLSSASLVIFIFSLEKTDTATRTILPYMLVYTYILTLTQIK